MYKKLSSVYPSPKGYWRGISAVKKLAAATKVSEKVAGEWLRKQATWQIYLPALNYIQSPTLNKSNPYIYTKRTCYIYHTTKSAGVHTNALKQFSMSLQRSETTY